MIKAPILLILLLTMTAGAPRAQTWNGTVSSSWNTAANWTPATVPTATSAVTIGNAAAPNQPGLQNDVNIASLNMTAGKLDLAGFTLTATGTVTLDGDSLTGGKIAGANIANFADTRVVGKLTLQKTGTTGTTYHYGNNKVYADSLILLWGGGSLYLQYGGVPDSVFGSYAITTSGTGTLFLGHNAGLRVTGNLALSNPGGSTYSLSQGPVKSIGGSVVWGAGKAPSLTMQNVQSSGAGANGPFSCADASIQSCSFAGSFSLTADSNQSVTVLNNAFLGAVNVLQAGEFTNFQNNIFNSNLAGTTTVTLANNTTSTFASYTGGNKVRGSLALRASTRPGSGGQNVQWGYYGVDSVSGAATYRLTNNAALTIGAGGGTQYTGGDLTLDADNGAHTFYFHQNSTHRVGGSFLAQNFVPGTPALTLYNITASGTTPTGTMRCGNATISGCAFAGDFTLLSDSASNVNLISSQFLGANNTFRSGEFSQLTDCTFGQTGTGLTTHDAANKTASVKACYLGGNKVRGAWLLAGGAPGAGAVNLFPGYYGPDSCFGNATYLLRAASNITVGPNYTGGNLTLDAAGTSHNITFANSSAHAVGGSFIAQAFSGNTGTLNLYNITAAGTAATGNIRCGAGTIQSCLFGGDFNLVADSAQNFDIQNSVFSGADNSFQAGQFFQLRDNIFGQAGIGTTTHVAANKTTSGFACYLGGNRIRNNWSLAGSTVPGAGSMALYPNYYNADSCFGTATWRLTNSTHLFANGAADTAYVAGNLILDADGGNHVISFSSAGAQVIGGMLQAANFSANDTTLSLNDVWASGTAPSGTFRSGAGSITGCMFGGDFTLVADSAKNFNIQNSAFNGANNSFTAGQFFQLRDNVFGQAGSGTTTHIAANSTTGAFNCYLGGNRIRNNWLFHAAPRAGAGSMALWPNYYNADSCFGTATWKFSANSSLNADNTNDTAYTAGNLILDADGGGHTLTFNTAGAHYIGGSLQAQNFVPAIANLNFHYITSAGTAPSGVFHSGNTTVENCRFAGDFTMLADSGQNFTVRESQFLGANNMLRGGQFFYFTNNVFGQAGIGNTTIAATNKTATAFAGYDGGNRYRGPLTRILYAPAGGSQTWQQSYYSPDSMGGAFALQCFGAATANLANQAAAFFGGSISISNAGTGTVQSTASIPLVMYGIDTAAFSYTGTEPILRRVRMNKVGGLRLLSPLRIHTNVTLDTGVILTTTANMLTVLDGATATGLQKRSFVDGPMKKIGNDIFTFPVGDSIFAAPIGITAPATITDEFVARYYRIPPHAAGYDTSNKDPGIVRLSSLEYWMLERTAGTSGVKVTLSHDSARSGLITNQASLLVAHWKGTTPSWQNEGAGITTGNIYAGTVQSTNTVTTFSPFTLGSSSAGTPLPVTGLDFSAQAEGTTARLTWKARNERGIARYDVERSAYGDRYERIGTTMAGANSTTYEHRDANPLTGRNLYRIAIIGEDGSVTYSAVRSLTFAATGAVRIFPNPAGEYLWVEAPAAATVAVYAADGRMMLRGDAPGRLMIGGLPGGVYFIRVQDARGEVLLTERLVKE